MRRAEDEVGDKTITMEANFADSSTHFAWIRLSMPRLCREHRNMRMTMVTKLGGTKGPASMPKPILRIHIAITASSQK